MRQKFIYLHIGEPKTATTYIQRLSVRNFDILKHKFNIQYPKTGVKKHGGHHLFSRFCIYRGSSDFQIQDLLTEIYSSDVRNILISSENFGQFLDGEGIEFLYQHLNSNRDFCVIPILYLRNWLHGAFSIWQQRIKGGLTTPFNEMFDGPLQEIIQDQIKMVKSWSCFFRRQIKIVAYDNLKENQEDPLLFLIKNCLNIHDFYQKNELELALPLAPPNVINSSLQADKLELIRQINYRLGKNVWKTVNLDKQYKNILLKAKVFKKKYTFHELAGNNAELLKNLNESNCHYIMNNISDRIINPHNCHKLFFNQDYLPTFEVVPKDCLKKYLDLEDNFFKNKKLREELQALSGAENLKVLKTN